MAQQLGGEGGGVRVAHEDGKPCEIRRPLRQLVDLAVGHHLQPVFDAAKKAIGRGQFGRGTTRDVPGTGQDPERAKGGGNP